MKNKQKKLWKVAKKIMLSITYLSIMAIFVLPCAVELEKAGIIIYLSCLGWLGLMEILYLFGKRYNF